MHADREGKLEINEEAKQFGVPPHKGEFFERAITSLREPGGAGIAARRLVGGVVGGEPTLPVLQ